jgi:hypothetical protein
MLRQGNVEGQRHKRRRPVGRLRARERFTVDVTGTAIEDGRRPHVRTLFAFSRDQVEQRTQLETQAIEYGWSARRLLEEVQKARGEKRQGGGPKFKYKDLRRWTIEAQRYLGGLFDEVDPESGNGKLVVERVLAKSGENLEDLKALSKAAARISELAGELSERAAKQRRSRRKPPKEKRSGK